MKVVFITSSLEPGKDGVGDYTRLLGGELVALGVEVAMLALNDSWCDEVVEESNVLRLPMRMGWDERVPWAEQFLKWQSPDWVSLQFVCYGFHPKGIVRSFIPVIERLCGRYRVHIMFHEIWVGEALGCSLKERAYRLLQRYFIKQMVQGMKPQCIHSNPVSYQRILKNNGMSSEHLPIFGNIPFVSGESSCMEARLWGELGFDDDVGRENCWFFGFFGSIYSVWPEEPLFSYLSEACRLHKKTGVILSAGRLGNTQRSWDRLVEKYSSVFAFLRVEDESVEGVSNYLQNLDFGIATTPWSLIGKSGAVAAMLDHGLPVLVNRDDIQFKGIALQASDVPKGVFLVTEELSKRLPEMKRREENASVKWIAKQFLESLNEAVAS